MNAEEVRDHALDRTDKTMIDISKERKEEMDVAKEGMRREIGEIIKINLIDF